MFVCILIEKEEENKNKSENVERVARKWSRNWGLGMVQQMLIGSGEGGKKNEEQKISLGKWEQGIQETLTGE